MYTSGAGVSGWFRTKKRYRKDTRLGKCAMVMGSYASLREGGSAMEKFLGERGMGGGKRRC